MPTATTAKANRATAAVDLADALRRYVTGPGAVHVVTRPRPAGAVDNGARVFYERLGFRPGEPAGPGSEGGSRQVYRLPLQAHSQPQPQPQPWSGCRKNTP